MLSVYAFRFFLSSSNPCVIFSIIHSWMLGKPGSSFCPSFVAGGVTVTDRVCLHIVFQLKGKKKGFTICVGPTLVCDLDVIQILNAGCWLHVNDTIVCFCSEKYTMHLYSKTTNEGDRFGAEMQTNCSVSRFSVGHHRTRADQSLPRSRKSFRKFAEGHLSRAAEPWLITLVRRDFCTRYSSRACC